MVAEKATCTNGVDLELEANSWWFQGCSEAPDVGVNEYLNGSKVPMLYISHHISLHRYIYVFAQHSNH